MEYDIERNVGFAKLPTVISIVFSGKGAQFVTNLDLILLLLSTSFQSGIIPCGDIVKSDGARNTAY